MSKYNEITEGMTVVDIANEESGYNYFGKIRKNGEWAIMRQKTNELEYRFAIGASDYSTNWSNRASLSYNFPTIG